MSRASDLTLMAEKISWHCALFLAVMLLLSCCDDHGDQFEERTSMVMTRNREFMRRPCDEIYVVKEGETLHTISEKCGDPFIVEENPHIQDPDDVFPGLVIKITHYKL